MVRGGACLKFSTLGGLFSHYHEVRASMSGARTNMPDAEALRMECFVGNPVKARSGMEYRKALVGDVQLYLRQVEWWEAFILLGRMRPPGHEQISWGGIVKILQRVSNGRGYPKYMKDKRNVASRYRKNILPLAEDHFRQEGYLR
jgi:hypothetical protein